MKILLKFFSAFIVLISIFSILGCRNQVKDITDYSGVKVEYADSVKASKYIASDSKSLFFQYLTGVDMAIQMKRPGGNYPKLEEYKKFLTTQVSSISDEEREFLSAVLSQALLKISKLNKQLLPDTIIIAKIKPGLYGEDVYFTRDKVIYVPQSALNIKNEEYVEGIIIHEIWHIISRQNENLRNSLYELIGFEPTGQMKVEIPEDFKKLLLTNPDAPVVNHYIQLVDDSMQNHRVIPLIFSRSQMFDSEKTGFFEYLDFSLFKLAIDGRLIISENQESFYMSLLKDYMKKTGGNTNYIIHPEEIIADNFMLIIRANYSEDFSKFEESGLQLAEKIMDLLKSYK